MAKNDQEIEVKFLVRDLQGLENRLKFLGARLKSERVHELNLRFDTPHQTLRNGGQVLRLRKDQNAVVTYKGSSNNEGGASVREEIEFQVSDFEAARRVFEALGYRVVVTYEKYRTTYALGGVLVTLDEMPYGSFAEIESNSAVDAESATSGIRIAAGDLRLDWEARSTSSYLALFDHLKYVLKLSANHLTFEEMKGIHPTPEDLGLQFADTK